MIPSSSHSNAPVLTQSLAQARVRLAAELRQEPLFDPQCPLTPRELGTATPAHLVKAKRVRRCEDQACVAGVSGSLDVQEAWRPACDERLAYKHCEHRPG